MSVIAVGRLKSHDSPHSSFKFKPSVSMLKSGLKAWACTESATAAATRDGRHTAGSTAEGIHVMDMAAGPSARPAALPCEAGNPGNEKGVTDCDWSAGFRVSWDADRGRPTLARSGTSRPGSRAASFAEAAAAADADADANVEDVEDMGGSWYERSL
ncbi:hypothetical protein BN1708_001509 [Verticillium longisporum]|uniref:Uncharacterized protein n=1 Tax=Verticillium longisporum TaxID=100787 RepID=A0A0G4MTI4_VERLO|nr:hypothetical protein BN1708_001509 [Verticillium longisporum]